MSVHEPGDPPADLASDATGQPGDPRLDDLLDAIAEGREVDWAGIRRNSGLPESIIRQYEVLAGVARVNRDPPEPEASQSIGHVLAAATTQAPATAPDAGIPWGPLRRLERVGSGAFGDVYRAFYPELETFVALKMLRMSKLTGAARHRAAADARLLARIRHPNIISVHGAAEIDGELGVWMDFIHGRTLDHIVGADGQMSAQEAMVVGESLCDALAAAHQASVLHRDIKAENVMRETGGKIVLLDFGIGGDIVSSDGSGVGAAGTPLYMAPELFRGAPASVQTDIYSLGILLFYLVTGTFPVVGRTYNEVREKHDGRRRVLLADVRPGLPRQFLRIVERATAFDPADRYATAGAMLADFDDAGAPEPSTWEQWYLLITVCLVLFALVPYVLGLFTTGVFNMALDRAEPFTNESVLDTWKMGQRLLFMPSLYALVTFMACRIVSGACGRLASWSILANRSLAQRGFAFWRRARVTVATAHPRALTDAMLLTQVVIIVLIGWLFWNVIGATLSKLTDTDPELLAPLRKGYYWKHTYIYATTVAILATIAAWARILKRHKLGQIGFVNASVGGGLIAVLFVLLALPYRLVFAGESRRVDYRGMHCYLVDDSKSAQRALIYCPEAPAPKTRTVPLDASLVETGEKASIYAPVRRAAPPFILTP